MVTEVFLSVTGAVAEARHTGKITEKAVGIPVHVCFCGDAWNDLNKILIVSAADVTKRAVIDNGESFIPWECLIAGERLYIGVDGVDENGTVRIPTTLVYCGDVAPSVAGLTPEDENEPTPELTAQILSVANNAEAKVLELIRRANSGEFNGNNYTLTDDDKVGIAEILKRIEFDDFKELVDSKIEAPSTASVGQMIIVKAVNADGKPTAWEAVNIRENEKNEWKNLAEIVYTTDVQTSSLPPIDLGNCKELMIYFTTVSNNTASMYVCDNNDEDIIGFSGVLANGTRYGKIYMDIIDGNLFVENYINTSVSSSMSSGQMSKNHFYELPYGSYIFETLNLRFGNASSVLRRGTKFTFYGR